MFSGRCCFFMIVFFVKFFFDRGLCWFDHRSSSNLTKAKYVARKAKSHRFFSRIPFAEMFSFYCNYYDRMRSNEIESKWKIFIILWHVVRCRQRNTWIDNGPPIWCRIDQQEVRCVNVNEFIHWSRLKSTILQRCFDLVSHRFYDTRINHINAQPYRSYCSNISVVNHKAAEAHRIIAFFYLIPNTQALYGRNKEHSTNKNNIDFSSFEKRFVIQLILIPEQLFSLQTMYYHFFFSRFMQFPNHTNIFKRYTHCAIFINWLSLFSRVTSTYNHVGYLHLSSHTCTAPFLEPFLLFKYLFIIFWKITYSLDTHFL